MPASLPNRVQGFHISVVRVKSNRYEHFQKTFVNGGDRDKFYTYGKYKIDGTYGFYL